MPEPNTGDRNSHGSRVEKFRTAKFRRGSPDGGVIFSFAVTHKSGVPITKGNSEDGARVSRTNTRRLSSAGLWTTGRTKAAGQCDIGGPVGVGKQAVVADALGTRWAEPGAGNA